MAHLAEFRPWILSAAMLTSYVLTACGNSGGAEAVEGLIGPSQMSVVTSGAGASPATPGAEVQTSAATDPGFDATTDYVQDESNVYVYDRSMENLQLINEILCMVTQTRYDRMVNRGPYNALIDEALCQQGQEDAGTGQSSGGSGTAPNLWVVDSTRADNRSPQIVNIWFTEDDDDGTRLFRVRLTIDEGVTPQNPWGEFHADFAAVPIVGGDINDPLFQGYLATTDSGSTDLGFVFYNDYGDITVPHAPNERSELVQVTVNMGADQTTGVARVQSQLRYNFGSGDTQESVEYELAFDPTNVLRATDGVPECMSRVNFDSRVWRYNMYAATGVDAGSRVELNGGFGIQTSGGRYGWAGYHGIWVPEDVTLADGDTVTHNEFGSSSQTTYTVRIAPGKLVENSRNTLDLTELENATFEWWDFSGGSTRYLIEQRVGSFWKTHTYNNGTDQWDVLPGGDELVDTAALGYLNMWSYSLGGNVSYLHGDAFVTYYAQEFVNGASDLFAGGSTAQLYGFIDCLKPAISQVDADSGLVYLADAPDVATPYSFRIDEGDLTLQYDPVGDGSVLQQVGLDTGVEPTTGPFTWGMRSGPLVTSTAGLTSIYDVWSAPVFYTYETGHNVWNQYSQLVDALGDAVAFDPPIQFTYSHATACDVNGDATYDGAETFMGYNGPGDLHGIPHDGVDLDGNGSFDRWYPRFGLADGTVLGPTGSEYVTKATETELSMQTDPGQCGSLDLVAAGALVLPDESGYDVPDIGDMPVVNDPPAVIRGEIQQAP